MVRNQHHSKNTFAITARENGHAAHHVRHDTIVLCREKCLCAYACCMGGMIRCFPRAKGHGGGGADSETLRPFTIAEHGRRPLKALEWTVAWTQVRAVG